MLTELTIMPNTRLISLPSVDITIRPGVMSDIPFMDSLQKLHTKQVGWMPTKQFEEKIRAGHVLIAEEGLGVGVQGLGKDAQSSSSLNPNPRTLNPIGYCIGNDQYFKRDDVGIIYQMNVLPGRQRGLVGASLLKAQFDRSAYGCRLYCCWCAQDIAANKFWESMGFVPLAFRTGSRTKGARGTPRVHIFWQKRIRAGDIGDVAQGGTPWWFPSKTDGGSIREDRIVLPIPPGTHWSDAKPLVLPGDRNALHEPEALATDFVTSKALPEKIHGRGARATKKAVVETPALIRRNGLLFDIPKQGEPLPEAKPQKSPKEKTPRMKPRSDPRLVAAARELRDRYLDEVNTGRFALAPAEAKYALERDAAKPVVASVAALAIIPVQGLLEAA